MTEPNSEQEKEVKIPGSAYSEWVHARLWIKGKSSSFVGIGRIELLENIEQFGSMNRAAKEMGMSYKKAWKLIDELNTIYDEPLVVKAQGGKSGGGSVLTPRGQALLKLFRKMEADLQGFLQTIDKEVDEFNHRSF